MFKNIKRVYLYVNIMSMEITQITWQYGIINNNLLSSQSFHS